MKKAIEKLKVDKKKLSEKKKLQKIRMKKAIAAAVAAEKAKKRNPLRINPLRLSLRRQRRPKRLIKHLRKLKVKRKPLQSQEKMIKIESKRKLNQIKRQISRGVFPTVQVSSSRRCPQFHHLAPPARSTDKFGTSLTQGWPSSSCPVPKILAWRSGVLLMMLKSCTFYVCKVLPRRGTVEGSRRPCLEENSLKKKISDIIRDRKLGLSESRISTREIAMKVGFNQSTVVNIWSQWSEEEKS
ncbi:hypothetical protein LAZ67_7002958 [Cordylochernes scorpioides]|uniref:Uncharacterized protein n=1 Tax=Cordylochernes scorpioides TaxID=51811 RepID=A0ABY6KNN4_9ARAC|nr:hypothetical protein LAZ67_7002958 [Cordylochernes scorpioides]